MPDNLSRAAAIESATATNLNTQLFDNVAVNNLQSDDRDSVSGNEGARSGSPAVSDPQSDGQKSVSGSGRVSNLPRSRYPNIQSTWFTTNVDLKKIRAHARWHPDQHAEQETDIFLDIHWAPKHAFVKLWKRLPLQAGSGPVGTSRGGRNVYVFIYPERIHQLSFTAKPSYMPFGHATIAFTFYLSIPPALIRPKSRTVFTQKAEEEINSLQSLVKQSSFTIYAASRRGTSYKRLQEFCDNVTEQKLATIEKLAGWANLYQDASDEAELIEGDSLLGRLTDRDDAAASRLPVYQEIAPSIFTSSTKRKRCRDESPDTGQTVQDVATGQTSIENSDARFAVHKRKMEEMFSAHERKLEERLSAHERKMEEIYSARERAMLSTIKRDVEDMVEEKMDERLDERLEERLDERIDLRAEDVRNSVLEAIASTTVSATLTFPADF